MNTNSFTRIIISCLIGAASCGSAMAQKLASGAVAIDSLHTYVEGNRVDVAFSLNLNNLKLKSEQQLVFTPMLAADGDTISLSPIIINGRSKQIRMERSGELASGATGSQQPLVVVRKNGTRQSVSYAQSVTRERPFESDCLSLLTSQDICGCGDRENLDNLHLATIDNIGAWMPALTFVKPFAEARKQRAEKGEAYLSFRVNKTNIVANTVFIFVMSS